MGSFELSDRSRRLLATLVREYIETGEPVSSQVLARESGLGVSSATVRNVLAQLEEAGYVHQPHTSAGRCRPTAATACSSTCCSKAARPSRPPADVENQLRQQAGRSPLMDDLLASVSHLVSRAARHVGFALAGNRRRRAAAHRVRAARRLARPGGRGRRAATRSRRRSSTPARTLRPDDLVQAAQLPEHRVRRPAAARGARGGAGAAAAGAHALRRAAGAARCAWRSRRSSDCPASRRSTSKAPRRCSTTRRTTACRWPRCARCSR